MGQKHPEISRSVWRGEQRVAFTVRTSEGPDQLLEEKQDLMVHEGASHPMWGENVRSETVDAIETAGERGAQAAQDAGTDPRVQALGTAVVRLRAELDMYPAELRDRRAAEDQLDALAAMVRSGTPEVPALRQALLLASAALGSVSALADPLTGLRDAVELFGGPPPR